MLYVFKLGHNIFKASENICYTKNEGAINQIAVTRWTEKFSSDYKTFDD